MSEAIIVINGVPLTNAQSAALRVAVTDFRAQLTDPEVRDRLGPIGSLYDQRLREVEVLLFRKR
jgi:hypothetical protein